MSEINKFLLFSLVSDGILSDWETQVKFVKELREKEKKEEDELLKLEEIENKKKIKSSSQRSQVLQEVIRQKYDNKRFVENSMNYRKKREEGKIGSNYEKFLKSRISVDDFDFKRLIGQGAYGAVYFTIHKKTKEQIAMKVISKKTSYCEAKRIRFERDAMVAIDSPWIVKLKYCFQDAENVYFGMEFCQGGDLCTLIVDEFDCIRKTNSEKAKEKEAAFYIAEIICAVEAIHKMNCCHRDLKPDNILIDKNGHIRITDFGLSRGFGKRSEFLKYCNESDKKFIKLKKNKEVKKLDSKSGKMEMKINREVFRVLRKQRQLFHSILGTPCYTPPEVLEMKGYQKECDWWCVGMICWEMVFNKLPFFAPDNLKTIENIKNYRNLFVEGEEIEDDDSLEMYGVSKEFIDMVKNLICSARSRVGSDKAKYKSIKQFKQHPFFVLHNIDWENLRDTKPPFPPELKDDMDLHRFDQFPKNELHPNFMVPEKRLVKKNFKDGYYYSSLSYYDE